MRIPTSTIVMGLVTCIPFALAIRQGTPNRHADDDDEVDAEMAMARDAQMRADMAARKAHAEEAKAEELHRLYGAEPATPGLLFGGIELGMPEITPTQERNLHTFAAGTVTTQLGDTGLEAIRVRLHDDCDTLETKLTDTWGPGTTTPSGTVWLNPAKHSRARIHSCSLIFDQYATVEEWIAKSDKSIVPLWAIGQPAEKLTDALTRPPGDAKASRFPWTAVGVGIGSDVTHLSAEIDHGRIAGINAIVSAEAPTITAVRDQLVSLFGEPRPPKAPDPDDVAGETTTRWDGKLPILLETTDNGFALSVGSSAKRAK
jgi:hypothetical protein